MTPDTQVQIGIVLGLAAALGVITLALGAAMEWLLGPVQPEAVADDDVPSFARPLHSVLTAHCSSCGELRLLPDLAYMRGLGYVCLGGCEHGRAV
jgi:hypothetical protein